MKRSSAFTLVELAVVIVILGILVAIAVPKFVSASETAESTAVAASEASMQDAITMYYAKNHSFPTNLALRQFVAQRGQNVRFIPPSLFVRLHGTCYEFPIYDTVDCSGIPPLSSTTYARCIGRGFETQGIRVNFCETGA